MFGSVFTSRYAVSSIVIITTAAVAVAAGIYLIPGEDAQLPPPAAFDLTIAEPYDGATVLLHDKVDIRADTHTSPVPSWIEYKSFVDLKNDKYELWMDGTYVRELVGEARALDRGRYAYTLWISWEPSASGMYTLVIRGKNKFWNAVSNVVHVKVVDFESKSCGDTYKPLPGESLQTVAEKFGVSPIMMGAANPIIPSLRDPLGTEMPIFSPKAFEPIDTPSQEDIPVGENGNCTGGDSEPPLKPISKIALLLELGLNKAGFI